MTRGAVTWSLYVDFNIPLLSPPKNSIDWGGKAHHERVERCISTLERWVIFQPDIWVFQWVYIIEILYGLFRVTWRSLNQNLASSSRISLRSPWTLDIKHPTILWICMLLRKERLSLWLYAGTSWCLVTLYQAFSLRSSSFELAVDMNPTHCSQFLRGIFYPPSSLNTASLGRCLFPWCFPAADRSKTIFHLQLWDLSDIFVLHKAIEKSSELRNYYTIIDTFASLHTHTHPHPTQNLYFVFQNIDNLLQILYSFCKV